MAYINLYLGSQLKTLNRTTSLQAKDASVSYDYFKLLISKKANVNNLY